MKASYNWLREFLNLDHSPEEISEILTAIGLEVEGLEKVEAVPGGLEGVVVGEVLTRDQHPNADRLSVTTVNIGNGEPLHIVCGAPNVAAGQKVLVATVGTTLFMDPDKPLKIKKGKIRGEVSEGMICAEDELGLGDNHDGIMVLPDQAVIGTKAADHLKLESDYVYEIGLTPNRSDATAHLGVAKDLAAYLKINTDKDWPLNAPDVSAFASTNSATPIPVEVLNPVACPRYASVLLTNVVVGPSPEWLQRRLLAIGVRPINNVVDITNYVLHELGQPLHAFDADKIKGNKVIVDTLPQDTAFTTLDEIERKLDKEDLMICNGNREGMCIGGVFGGIHTGVTDQTKRIFLESAHFHPTWIRRTSVRHLLRTDASKVFEKGSDPNVVLYALKRAALLLKEYAGATIATPIHDFYPKVIEPKQIAIRYRKISQLIGLDLSPELIKEILLAQEMEIVREDNDGLTVAVPTNKADVLREVDIIEEVLRIYGLNNVPLPGQMQMAVTYSDKVDSQALQNRIGDLLAAQGFLEMMALSISQSKFYTEIDALTADDLVYINNTSNVQLDCMRGDMLPSALESVLHNQNRQHPNVRFFEFGKTYKIAGEGFSEHKKLSLSIAGERHPENWLRPTAKAVDFYTLKSFVDQVFASLGIQGFQVRKSEDKRLAYGLDYHRGPKVMASYGMVRKKIGKYFDLKKPVFFAELHWDLLESATGKALHIEPLNRFPNMRRDLALVVDKTVTFEQIAGIARKQGKKMLKDVNLFDVYESDEHLGVGKKSCAISLVFEDSEKNLSGKEVDKVMQKLIGQYEQQLGAMIRR